MNENNNDDEYGFSDFFNDMRNLAFNDKYCSLPQEKIITAFATSAQANGAIFSSPYVQNTRVKKIQTLPVNYSRQSIENMLKSPLEHELGLRQVAQALNYSSYPFYKLNKDYADMLTYKWFYRPAYISEMKNDTRAYKKEQIFVDKFCKKVQPSLIFRIIAQRSLIEGKVAYVQRESLDKEHNNVEYAALQELPSDHIKIVGRNNVSYWTAAFDFSYFWQAGTDINDFPPYFREYYNILRSVTEVSGGTKYTNGGKVINFSAAQRFLGNHPEIEIEKKNSRYYFWVTLPVDKCWVFGFDFSSPIQASNLMGLFLTLQDLQSYEYLQQQLTQIPLYAFLSGEIPYFEEKTTAGKKIDNTKMSPQAYTYYQQLFYIMTGSNNTRGLDIYAAPFKNMQLHQLNEIPNSNNITTAAYQQFLTKAGVTGIKSTSDKPTASMVNASQKLEKRYADILYEQFDACMNSWLRSLELKHEWRFHMFGDVYTEKELLERLKGDLAVGQSYLFFYKIAMDGLTLQDAIDMATSVRNCGVYDLFLNVQSAFNTSGKESAVPQKAGRKRLDIDDVDNENTEISIERREDL